MKGDTSKENLMKKNGSFCLQQQANPVIARMTNAAAHAMAQEKVKETMRSLSKNGKENVCYNGDSKLANQGSASDLIKMGMNKFSKYISRKKSQIMNSNNINIRRNYGSNDQNQGAPSQHKYAANKFNCQNKSN